MDRLFSSSRSIALLTGTLALLLFVLHLIFEPNNMGILIQLITTDFHPKFGFHSQAFFLISFRILRLIFGFYLFIYLLYDDALKEAGYLYLIRQTLGIFLMVFSSKDQSSLVYLIVLSLVMVLSTLCLVFFLLGFLRHRAKPVFIWGTSACLILLVIAMIGTLFAGTKINMLINFIQIFVSILYLSLLLLFLYTDTSNKKTSPKLGS